MCNQPHSLIATLYMRESRLSLNKPVNHAGYQPVILPLPAFEIGPLRQGFAVIARQSDPFLFYLDPGV